MSHHHLCDHCESAPATLVCSDCFQGMWCSEQCHIAGLADHDEYDCFHPADYCDEEILEEVDHATKDPEEARLMLKEHIGEELTLIAATRRANRLRRERRRTNRRTRKVNKEKRELTQEERERLRLKRARKRQNRAIRRRNRAAAKANRNALNTIPEEKQTDMIVDDLVKPKSVAQLLYFK